MDDVWVIFNPYANRWRAREQWPRVEKVLRDAGLRFTVKRCETRGDPIRWAAEGARKGIPMLVAAGGDGTVGEVVNGMAQVLGYDAARWPILGLLPLGSANDLVANLGLPGDPVEAARLLVMGKPRPMDVLQVNEWAFVNNAALGMEPRVTLTEKRIQRVHGVLRYVLAAFWVLARPQHWRVRMTWDDGAYEGMATLISVGNWPRTGGIFYPTPHAQGFDGRLTFLYGYIPSSFQVLRLLLQAMGPEGRHVDHPGVHEIHATRLEVHCEPPSPMHADGEIRTEGGTYFAFRTWPGRVPVMLPEEEDAPS